ncbi:MAG: hypothetical protein MJZ33_04720 [Paludibacteraceae bacterium]|nr:hypothetical protein [Paludibacteraceae bacterium]
MNTNKTKTSRVVTFFFVVCLCLSCSDRYSYNVYVSDVFSWSNSSLCNTQGFLHFELLYINKGSDTLYIKDQYENIDGYLPKENPVLTSTFLCIKDDTLYGNRSYVGEHIDLTNHSNLELKKISPYQRMQVRFTVPQSAIHNLYLKKYDKVYDETEFLLFVANNAVLETCIIRNGKLEIKRLSGFGDYMRLETIDSEKSIYDDYEEL